jgi:predicted Fe-S protein YdhL (DUF1289 family)
MDNARMLVPNPCVSICMIKNGICVGCQRTRFEISRWPRLTNEERQRVIARISVDKRSDQDGVQR